MNIITGNRKFLFFKYKLKQLVMAFIKQEKLISFGESINKINKVLIINLDRQKERWKLIQEELKNISINNNKTLLNITERFPAIDAVNQSINTSKVNLTYNLKDQYFVDPNPQLLNLIREKEINIDLTKQEIAVALSHIYIWEKIVKENIHNALIIEDDVYFENRFAKKLNSLWNEITKSEIEFDIIYLSYKKVDFNPDIKKISINISKPNRGIWWFSGYILSNKGAKKLLNKLPIVGPIDLWINRKFKDINVFMCNESIINQKLFLTSDNDYSILPILSQIGVKSNKTFIDLDKLKGHNPVFIFDISTKSKINLLKLDILLSLNSYRTYYNKLQKESNYIEGLINRKEALLFDAYIGFNSIIGMIPDIISFYPNAIVIIIHKKNSSFPKEVSQYSNKKLFLINCDINGNISKEVSKLLKIKNWNIDSEEIYNLNDIDSNGNAIKINIPNNYKYLEHDVNPWILPIQNMKNYLPYDFNENEIIPIGKLVENRFDSFKKLNLKFWKILENTFPSNQAQFLKENFKLSNILDSGFQLEITNKNNEGKQYSSSSIVSQKQYLYGSFEISMKPIKGNGIISVFFLHRNDPWQEIDVEFLGNETTKVLLNVYFNPGVMNTKYNYGVRGTPILIDLEFDVSKDFHTYRIEWEYHEIRWYVDNKVIHVRKTWTPTPIPNLPLAIFVNAWVSNSEALAGKFDDKELPKKLFVRYIKISNFDYNKTTHNNVYKSFDEW
jgi:GR25 family glycosyltransferase involved in LPS biosynthesis